MAGKPAGRLREIPSVDSILRRPETEALIRRHGHILVAEAVREALARLRKSSAGGEPAAGGLAGQVRSLLLSAVERRTRSSLRRVINATGVIVHTNLGRARLSDAARDRAAMAASAATTLEYDLPGGERGSRSVHIERPLSSLFPGRGALAVNNNAAAVFLALGVLARGKEVILSRGELVEIGGSFRIPEVMAASGASLREVGTTNRTRLSDYASAIHAGTGLILKVHPSNYRIVGFTQQVEPAELAELAARHGIPLMVDQGSGCLESLAPLSIEGEPTVGQLLEAGADLVTFSGDKILGGPQAGLAVGRPDLIERMRKDPLYRVLRLDKMTLAALEATLDAWARGTHRAELPVQRMIFAPAEEQTRRADAFARRLSAPLAGGWQVATLEGTSRIGGGAAPEQGLPTTLVALRAVGGAGDSVAAFEARLRDTEPPVIARLHEDALVIDLRTVPPEEEDDLFDALVAAAGGRSET